MAGATLRDGKGKFETPARVVKNADDGGAAGDRLTRSLGVAGALQSVLAARQAADCRPPCGGRPGRRCAQQPWRQGCIIATVCACALPAARWVGGL
jgi:hypothetical protein